MSWAQSFTFVEMMVIGLFMVPHLRFNDSNASSRFLAGRMVVQDLP